MVCFCIIFHSTADMPELCCGEGWLVRAGLSWFGLELLCFRLLVCHSVAGDSCFVCAVSLTLKGMYALSTASCLQHALVSFLHESASGASVVAIDNKIEQAMDLVKNHLMYAVREEVEVLKEQIKDLVEKNSQLERENCLLKNLASPEQMKKFQSRLPADETREISSLDFIHATQPRSAGSAV
ncbi:TSC22 domain family protein 1-like isoform X2 [Eleutherodactylus coqui]|uniref:TSC22 domain family protein 1-like isoform X2 n=1 Tax=Eleutherodactylus coqui TaxID=57060 RepID=UPI003461B7CF